MTDRYAFVAFGNGTVAVASSALAQVARRNLPDWRIVCLLYEKWPSYWQRPGSRSLTSWSTQLFPSGSLKVAYDA